MIDKATADKEDIAVGDTIYDHHDHRPPPVHRRRADRPRRPATASAGRRVALFDLDTAAKVLGAEGVYDTIDLRVAEGADIDTVQQALEQALPDNVEVVTRDTLNKEAMDSVNSFIGPFGTGLLVFAFITAFVSAFLINNVFAITIGQRLRELALLRADRRQRAPGAPADHRRGADHVDDRHDHRHRRRHGRRQADHRHLQRRRRRASPTSRWCSSRARSHGVRRRRRHHARAPSSSRPAVRPRSRRSRRCDPSSASTRSARSVSSSAPSRWSSARCCSWSGCSPGRAARTGLILLAGGGALLLFLGTASVASTVAKPVTRMIGWPVGKLYKAPGAAGPGQRRPGAQAHVGHGCGADDRGGARQRGLGVRRVAARHVRRRHRPRHHRRLRRAADGVQRPHHRHRHPARARCPSCRR